MPRPITVDLDQVAEAISNSFRHVLISRGLIHTDVRYPGSMAALLTEGEVLSLIAEVGRNAAQAVVSCEVVEIHVDEIEDS